MIKTRFITAGGALALALLVSPVAAAAPAADSAETHLSVRAPKTPALADDLDHKVKEKSISLELSLDLTVRASRSVADLDHVEQPQRISVPQLRLVEPAPPAPTTTVTPPPAPAPVAIGSSSASSAVAEVAISATGHAAVDAALSRQGDPYVWGGTTPGSFDCSGLTSWAFAQTGVSIPRTSQAQMAAGTPVSLDALQPGDIIGYYSGATHVAMYIGNGQVVHASTYGVPVGIADLYHAPIYGAVRY